MKILIILFHNLKNFHGAFVRIAANVANLLSNLGNRFDGAYSNESVGIHKLLSKIKYKKSTFRNPIYKFKKIN